MRQPYRTDFRTRLDALDERRERLGISHSELAGRAGVSTRTWRRMRSEGLAFRRHVNAVAIALRTLEREQHSIETQYPEGDE